MVKLWLSDSLFYLFFRLIVVWCVKIEFGLLLDVLFVRLILFLRWNMVFSLLLRFLMLCRF